MTLIDFTLSNARRFYSSMGNPFAKVKIRGTFQGPPLPNTPQTRFIVWKNGGDIHGGNTAGVKFIHFT